jgi:hypothetical protein
MQLVVTVEVSRSAEVLRFAAQRPPSALTTSSRVLVRKATPLAAPRHYRSDTAHESIVGQRALQVGWHCHIRDDAEHFEAVCTQLGLGSPYPFRVTPADVDGAARFDE